MTRRTKPATSTDDATTPLNVADDATAVLASRPSSGERTVDDDSSWSVVGSRKVDASGDATLAARAMVTEARVADDVSKEWAVRCHEPMRSCTPCPLTSHDPNLLASEFLGPTGDR